MIRVTLITPPADYETKVKLPGTAFLAVNPNPSGNDWKTHEYWRDIHDYLYDGHQGICAYCASWSPRRAAKPNDAQATSVDHYIPKSLDPQLAYEWSNFRLCRLRLNHRKGDFQDVLDPCAVSNAWFTLNMRTFFIRPAPGLPGPIHGSVTATIDRLELNKDRDYVNQRVAVIRSYTLGEASIEQLRIRYPFIAYQLEVQDFDNLHLPRLLAYFKKH